MRAHFPASVICVIQVLLVIGKPLALNVCRHCASKCKRKIKAFARFSLSCALNLSKVLLIKAIASSAGYTLSKKLLKKPTIRSNSRHEKLTPMLKTFRFY